ncbi:MAG TPA: glycosyltransferase family 39 protein [Candidatus Dormibacteraeota bacterium]|jgi:4-amino-4-deoxy-L-arabinose transferase-like glycosyltransferase|nr:glycosyltransferase family 39 protein [Candidatus Dormibacteraeota bacterium]
MFSTNGAAAPDSHQARGWLDLWSLIRTSQFWMVAIALFLRVGWIVIGHTYKFKSADNNFGFGWEMGSIGAAIASGHGFSNPFGPPTGPTAWEPPLYPYLVAGVFHFFGIYSRSSAFLLLTLNSIFSALTCIPIFFIARRIFSERVAVGSAWTWVFLPYVMYWCTRWVWETSLSALLIAAIFWFTLTLDERDGLKPWLGFGLLWGIAALNSTSLLAFLPASGLWAWYHRAKRGKRSLAGVMLASAIFLACITPWLVRNYETFGKFVFLRDNFGAELRLGNGNGADGTWMEYLHPTQDLYAMRQYQAMGELAYIETRKREALDYIRADYGRFSVLCIKRFIYYWAGVPRPGRTFWLEEMKNSLFLASSILMFWGLGRALRQRKPGAWLLFWLILLYPAIYYVVFPGQRYRHPIEPEITILAIYLLTEAGRNQTSGRRTATKIKNGT